MYYSNLMWTWKYHLIVEASIPNMEKEDSVIISSLRVFINYNRLFVIIRVNFIDGLGFFCLPFQNHSIPLYPICVLGGWPFPTTSSGSPALWLLVGLHKWEIPAGDQRWGESEVRVLIPLRPSLVLPWNWMVSFPKSYLPVRRPSLYN